MNSGNTAITGTLAAGNTTITGTANVSGAATFSNTVSIAGNVVSNVTFSANTTHVGAAAFSNTITVTGNATFSNTIAIGSDYISPYTGFKNRIINGDMRIDQRNAGNTVNATTATTWTVDRWMYYTNLTSKGTWGQNLNSLTPPAGFTKYLGFQSNSAYSMTSNDFTGFWQPIEGLNTTDLAWGTASAQPVTLSFWVRSSLTGTFSGSLRNGGHTLGYAFNYTINSANTWENKAVTVAGPTSGTWNIDNSSGIELLFSMGMGSTYSSTAGSWQAMNMGASTGSVNVYGTNGATFYLTGVQLEKGSTATAFDYRSFGQELQLCQRYYERSYDVGNGTGSFTAGWRGTSTNGAVYAEGPGWPFSVTKRAVPTVTFYNAVSGASGAAYQVSSAANTAISARYIGTTGVGIIDYTSSGGQNSYYIHYTALAEL